MEIVGQVIRPGESQFIEIPVGSLTNHAPVLIHANITRGRHEGPTLLVCACLHGDETNSAEIARRLLRLPLLKKIWGTLVVIPILNVPAFLNRSRYLPDRRDLNRLFPGTPNGSLGSRLAYSLSTNVLPVVDYVIDLHTGAINRPNLPQVRFSSGDARSAEMANHFGAKVILKSAVRDQSLRRVCNELGKPVLVFEGGEALRMDSDAIKVGLRGIQNVMRHLGMFGPDQRPHLYEPSFVCTASAWERAPKGGLFNPIAKLGKVVKIGNELGFIADPYFGTEYPILASADGIIIGRTNEGIADEGDALFHLAVTDRSKVKLTPPEQQRSVSTTVPEDEDDHPAPYSPYSDLI